MHIRSTFYGTSSHAAAATTANLNHTWLTGRTLIYNFKLHDNVNIPHLRNDSFSCRLEQFGNMKIHVGTAYTKRLKATSLSL